MPELFTKNKYSLDKNKTAQARVCGAATTQALA